MAVVLSLYQQKTITYDHATKIPVHHQAYEYMQPSYIPFKSRRQPHPVIRLAGEWLQESGFSIGQVVEIACEPGRLTITLAPAQNPAEVQALLQRQNIEIV